MRRTGGTIGASAFVVATCASLIVTGLIVTGLIVTGLIVTGRSPAGATEAGRSEPSVEIVSQNVLHGLACPAASSHCLVGKRMQLFVRNLDDAGCPQVVALQEANREVVRRLRGPLRTACGGRYEIVFDDDPSLDREVVLTTLPVLGRERIRLAGPLRSAFWVRVKARVGAVDLLATHLASGSDDGPCTAETCPPPCDPTGSLQLCQANQAVEYLDGRRTPRTVGVLVGDLNARPDEPTITAITGAGYVDTHLATGIAECDPATGSQCTGGRDDSSVASLREPTARQQERIDYVFLAPTPRCEIVGSGLFDAEPATDGPADLTFVSDHTGVQATIACTTTRADREAARRVRTTTTTRAARSATVPASVERRVTEAYETLFGGEVTDPDEKLAALQGAAALRDSFIARMQSVGDLATRTGVRIDSMTPAGKDAVDLVFTITIDGAAVLDQLPGRAIEVGGRWLVARSSYCQVATIGVETAPEGCR